MFKKWHIGILIKRRNSFTGQTHIDKIFIIKNIFSLPICVNYIFKIQEKLLTLLNFLFPEWMKTRNMT